MKAEDLNIVTLDELSAILKVPKKTIYGMVHQGKIPYLKFGRLLRFDLDKVYAWMDGKLIEEETIKPIAPTLPAPVKKPYKKNGFTQGHQRFQDIKTKVLSGKIHS
ncbi:MAG: helix-turn-helix domain-containing protein [Nitrospirae bacterium]|nr:helix-turn-helix domain-containing protein [Nitrospirota bacterium]